MTRVAALVLASALVACAQKTPEEVALAGLTRTLALAQAPLFGALDRAPRRLLTLDERLRAYFGGAGEEDPAYMSCAGRPLDDGGFEDVACYYYSIDNLHTFCEEVLWAEHVDSKGRKYRAPTGADSDCTPPYTAEKVRCWVHTTDAHFNKLEMVQLLCDGHRHCTGPECCKVLSRKPKYEAFEGW